MKKTNLILVDRQGNILAVNFGEKGTVGIVNPSGQGQMFVSLPQGSVGNATAISPQGRIYVADYVGHKVLTIDPKTKEVQTYVEKVGMSQPNDVVVSKEEVLYLTDPNWKSKSSRIWRVENGKAEVIYEGKEVFNGIDLSVDERSLILGDSRTNKIYRFKIADKLTDPEVLIQFKGHEIDGLKVDAEDNIYVARIRKGVIAKISSQGEFVQEISVNGMHPTNLVFGGRDGKTVYVTQRDGGFIESFRVDVPGRHW